MLPLLLLAPALAASPRVGLAVGPAIGGGTAPRGEYFTAAPAGAATITWNLGPFESWVGASGSLLMAGYADGVIPASLLQGELGIGLGSRAFGGGVYVGNGFPGPLYGLYGRGMLPGTGWVDQIGVETRLFHTTVTESTALAVMLRVEPGPGDRPRRTARGATERGEEAPAPGETVRAEPPTEAPPPSQTEGTAIDTPTPEGAPAPSPPATGEPAERSATHHDEPF